MVLLGGAFLALSCTRPLQGGLDLSIDGHGVSFQMKGAFITIAFDIGHDRPESNSAARLLG